MDHDGLKACKMSNDVGLLHSHEKQDRFGKVKSLSVCCGKLTDANSGYDKQRYESNHGIEISSCEAATLPEIRGKCPNYDNISSSDCTKGDANNLELVCSVVSISRNSAVEVGLHEKENCAEGTSGAMSCCDGRASSTCQNKLSGDGNLKDGGVSTQSLDGIHSTQHISVKSDVSSETGKSLNKERYESDIMRTKENWLNAAQDGSKSVLQATSHGMQLKTESSSSNSTHVTLPASSNESCQETSVDAKTCKHSRSSGMSSFICTGFKCSLEEPTVKSIALDMAAEIASKAPLNTSASPPGKQGSLARALGSVDSIRERDNEKVLGMIVDENSMIVENDFSRSSLLKKSNAECPNRDKAKLSYVRDDALEVAWRVAREVEQVVGIYGEASASSSSIEQKNDETIYLSSVDSVDPDSVDPNKKDFLIDSGHRIALCNEQDKCDSFCSTKDPESSVKNDLCLQVKKPSKEGLALIHEADDTLQGQESSQLTTIVEGEAVNGQIPHLCRFDLNEDIQENELEYPIQPVNENALSHHGVIVSMPIRVVAKSGVPTYLPMTPLKFEGEGWRGSAATSAFQPAPRSKSSNSINESSAKENDDSPKHSQDFIGIDLNVAASGDDFGMELSLKKCVLVPSDFPSKDSSVEVSSKQAKRLNIDLNCLGENEENCPQLSLPGSSSRQFIGDFDLNDNPSFGDACNYTHEPGQATQSLRNRALDDHAVLMGNARHPDSNGARVASCCADLSSMQGFGHSHAQPFPVAMTNVISPVEQMQKAVPPQPKLTLPAPPPPPPPRHTFLYNNGFCIDPTDSLPSTIYSPGALPYVTDQRGMTFIPQILYSSTLPAFPGAPHLMEVAAGPSPADIAIFRPGFDGLSSSETGNARQLFIPVSNSLMEEQMKSFRQGLKRREPDGGWDHSQQLGYRQDTSWR